MNKKNILIPVLMGMMLVMCFALVSATVTITYPTAGTSLNGSRTINISVSPATNNYTNVTLSFACVSPVAGASSTVATQKNLSVSDADFNVTWNTASPTGDCSGTLTATTNNDSNVAETATVTGIILNNTVNSVTFDSSSPASTADTAVSSGTFAVTTTEGVTGANLNYCGNSFGMTGSNTSWSYKFDTGTKALTEGICNGYSVTTTGTGSNDNAVTENRNIWVKYGTGSSGGAIQIMQAQQQAQQSKSNSTIAIVLLVSLAGYFFFFSGRK